MAMVPLSEEEGPGPSRFRQALVPFFCFFFCFLGPKKPGRKQKKNECTTKTSAQHTQSRMCNRLRSRKLFGEKPPPPPVGAFRCLCAHSALSLRRSVRGAGGTEKKTRQGGAHSPPWALQRVTRTCGLASMQCDLLSDGGEEDELEGGEVATLGGRGVPLLRVSEAFPSPLSGGGGGFDTRGDSGAGNPAPGPRPRLHHR